MDEGCDLQFTSKECVHFSSDIATNAVCAYVSPFCNNIENSDDLHIFGRDPIICLSCCGYLNKYCSIDTTDGTWTCVLCGSMNPPFHDLSPMKNCHPDEVSLYLLQRYQELQVNQYVSTNKAYDKARNDQDRANSCMYAIVIDYDLIQSTISLPYSKSDPINSKKAQKKDCICKEDNPLFKLLKDAIENIPNEVNRNVEVCICCIQGEQLYVLKLNTFCIENRLQVGSSDSDSEIDMSLPLKSNPAVQMLQSCATFIEVDMIPCVAGVGAGSDPNAAVEAMLQGDAYLSRMNKERCYAVNKHVCVELMRLIVDSLLSIQPVSSGDSHILPSCSSIMQHILTIGKGSYDSLSKFGADTELEEKRDGGAYAHNTNFTRLVLLLRSVPRSYASGVNTRTPGIECGIGAGACAGSEGGKRYSPYPTIASDASRDLNDHLEYESVGLTGAYANCYIDAFYVNEVVIGSTAGLHSLVSPSGGQVVTSEYLTDAHLYASFVACLSNPLDTYWVHSTEFSGDEAAVYSVEFYSNTLLKPVGIKSVGQKSDISEKQVFDLVGTEQSCEWDCDGYSKEKFRNREKELKLSIWEPGREPTAGWIHNSSLFASLYDQYCDYNSSIIAGSNDVLLHAERLCNYFEGNCPRSLAGMRLKTTADDSIYRGKVLKYEHSSYYSKNLNPRVHRRKLAQQVIGLLQRCGPVWESQEDWNSWSKCLQHVPGDAESTKGAVSVDGSCLTKCLKGLNQKKHRGVKDGKYYLESHRSNWRRQQGRNFSIFLEPQSPSQGEAEDAGGIGMQYGYVQCVVHMNAHMKVFTNRIAVHYPFCAKAPHNAGTATHALQQTKMAGVEERIVEGVDSSGNSPLRAESGRNFQNLESNRDPDTFSWKRVVLSQYLDNELWSLYLARHLVHQCTLDLSMTNLLFCKFYYVLLAIEDHSTDRKKKTKSASHSVPTGLSVGYFNQLYKHIREHYHVLIDLLLVTNPVVRYQWWKQAKVLVPISPLKSAQILSSESVFHEINIQRKIMRFCRYFYFLKTGPYLCSTTVHPSECHRAGLALLASFHGSLRSDSSALARIQPSVYLMFPEESPWKEYTSEADVDCSAFPLVQFPPDSIYLASTNALGVIDTGENVLVWVGDDFRSYDKNNTGSSEPVSKSVRGFIKQLHTCAKVMASSRDPCAGVRVVKQYSPYCRLIFSRLCCAQNDSMYLLSQYCPFLYSMILPTTKSNVQGAGDAGVPDGTDRMKVLEEYCAYLPPTDQISFMKYVSMVVPGFIQYAIHSRNSRSDQQRDTAPGTSFQSESVICHSLMALNQSCFTSEAHELPLQHRCVTAKSCSPLRLCTVMVNHGTGMLMGSCHIHRVIESVLQDCF